MKTVFKLVMVVSIFTGGCMHDANAVSLTPDQQAEVKAIALIAKHEGFRASVYTCPGGRDTIGYGFTDPEIVAKGSISRKEADRLLGIKVRKEIAWLNAQGLPAMSPMQKAALVSWVYNLGRGNFLKSTMLKRIKEGNWESASRECNKWVFSNGIRMGGLVARRNEEGKLLMQTTKLG